MSSFTGNTSIEPLPKENLWITTKSFRYYIYAEWSWPFIDIPEWYKFNGASVPRILWMFSPPAEPTTINSAALHDFLTETNQFWYFFTHKIFYDSLLISWNSYFKSIIFFIGVCIWGFVSYYKLKEKLINLFK